MTNDTNIRLEDAMQSYVCSAAYCSMKSAISEKTDLLRESLPVDQRRQLDVLLKMINEEWEEYSEMAYNRGQIIAYSLCVKQDLESALEDRK